MEEILFMTQILANSEIINESYGFPIDYPGKVLVNDYGKCYVASVNIEPKTVVERFFGPRMKYAEIPLEEICHAACEGDGYWMIPITNARYINHSCDPNCEINSKGEVCAKRFIKAEEEITFDYVTISKKSYLNAPQEYFWDPRWTFECRCGSINCHKKIDRYIIQG
jgi:hypothetical protein